MSKKISKDAVLSACMFDGSSRYAAEDFLRMCERFDQLEEGTTLVKFAQLGPEHLGRPISITAPQARELVKGTLTGLPLGLSSDGFTRPYQGTAMLCVDGTIYEIRSHDEIFLGPKPTIQE